MLSFPLVDECSVVIQRTGFSVCTVYGAMCIVHGTMCLVHPVWCMGNDAVSNVALLNWVFGRMCIACCCECI